LYKFRSKFGFFFSEFLFSHPGATEIDIDVLKDEKNLETYLDRNVVVDSNGVLLGASFERLCGWYENFFFVRPGGRGRAQEDR
jgi:hypothetical protein